MEGVYKLSSEGSSIASMMLRTGSPGGPASIATSLELLPGGKLKMRDTIPEQFAPTISGERVNTQETSGAWELNGASIVLKWDSAEPGHMALLMRSAMPDGCAMSPEKLTCTSSKRGDLSWVFVKRP